MRISDPQLKEAVSLIILELQFIVSNCYLEQLNSQSRFVLGFDAVVWLAYLSLYLSQQIFLIMLQVILHNAGVIDTSLHGVTSSFLISVLFINLYFVFKFIDYNIPVC